WDELESGRPRLSVVLRAGEGDGAQSAEARAADGGAGAGVLDLPDRGRPGRWCARVSRALRRRDAVAPAGGTPAFRFDYCWVDVVSGSGATGVTFFAEPPIASPPSVKFTVRLKMTSTG